MKTISAKDLRDNLDTIVARARAGETIKVTYRSKPAFTIVPELAEHVGPEPGSHEAIERFVSRVTARKQAVATTVFDPTKSIKALYHEMLDTDPKYQPPHPE